jgi:glyoxylase-like metal-dependent hydrolase (beta-lactamase superfamily II)
MTVANQGRTANVAFIVGPRGVVVVDSGVSYREAEDIISAVRRVSSQPIRLVILTHPGQEVIFGATAFQDHGASVLMHREAAALVASRCGSCLQNLKTTLGEDVMAATRVVEPDRLIDGEQKIDLIERRLRLIAPAWSSTPGALAVLDERTSTLIAGNLVSLGRIPDTRDADADGWRDALTTLRATRCRHLIPTYGPLGSCADIDAFARYFIRLESHVAMLIHEGVGLAELNERCDLPEYADWDQYDPLHRQNANRAYVRLERALFEDRTPGSKR